MIWDWEFTGRVIPDVLRGLLVTFEATVLGSVVAFALGLLLALLRRSRIRAVSRATWLFIEFVRSTPLLVQLYFLFNVLPGIGLRFSSLTTGVIGLGVHYACYTAEVYRAGIDGVPRGQWEAATALSLPTYRVWTSVVLPQAIPRVLPALGNYTISMFKETPLLLAIGVLDLVGAAQEAGSDAYRYVEPLTLAGICFLLLSYPASLLVRRLEHRVGS
ncbi:polar amino acid transport system permease protein [Saccharopolyspora antimicrobica]|uniref:Polar amino acid transport system permease protein n=1 Tax=Saccharopolyspora antimicrobica TaxID=455193 RepID=A0A1I5KHC0_9PSEU|nr:ectoine/hydroxyectoine ABC transporter permease subunit EhuD [Saccharopolyspora antimicrobica]RKT85685.1 polar amino acid transport system permease protein [Saccharopolyspora antimicrobica]SFO84378.1 polar amino acid transport system permease protein [Saccharopolyspora antimicrobica]